MFNSLLSDHALKCNPMCYGSCWSQTFFSFINGRPIPFPYRLKLVGPLNLFILACPFKLSAIERVWNEWIRLSLSASLVPAILRQHLKLLERLWLQLAELKTKPNPFISKMPLVTPLIRSAQGSEKTFCAQSDHNFSGIEVVYTCTCSSSSNSVLIGCSKSNCVFKFFLACFVSLLSSRIWIFISEIVQSAQV